MDDDIKARKQESTTQKECTLSIVDKHSLGTERRTLMAYLDSSLL